MTFIAQPEVDETRASHSPRAQQKFTWDRVSQNGLEPNSSWPEDKTIPIREQVDAARTWIREHLRPCKTIRPRHTSYGYKHDVERWSEENGGRLYVANGAFIVAMLEEGYRADRVRPRCINAFFNARAKRKSEP